MNLLDNNHSPMMKKRNEDFVCSESKFYNVINHDALVHDPCPNVIWWPWWFTLRSIQKQLVLSKWKRNIRNQMESRRMQVRYSSLKWRHNGGDSVSNHQPHDGLPKGLFRRRSKKTWKLRVTGLCAGNSGTGEFPHKITRKMFPFDDIIMIYQKI